MVATAVKPRDYNGFRHAPASVCRYAPKAEKMHRSVHTGKWALCDCIHLLRLVEKTLPTLIQPNDTCESTQIDAFLSRNLKIDAFFESKPKIDAFLKIDANGQRKEYKKAS